MKVAAYVAAKSALDAKGEEIRDEQQYFGKPHTDFDFKARDPAKEKKRLAQLSEARDKQAK